MKITPDKEIISSGESVTYTYEVENKGYVDLTDIELIDEKFGTIAKKFTLEKGETKTFTKTVALTVTTTNCAKATAVCRYEKRIKNVEKHACTTVDVRRQSKLSIPLSRYLLKKKVKPNAEQSFTRLNFMV